MQVEFHKSPESVVQVDDELPCLVESITHVPIAGVELWVGLSEGGTLDALHGGATSMDWCYLITFFIIVSIVNIIITCKRMQYI